MRCLAVIILSLVAVSLNAQVRKYYYDGEWKAIDDELFAAYYVAVKPLEAGDTSQVFRAFNLQGSMIFEGRCASIDTLAFFNSTFDGEWVSYHKNGEQKLTTSYKNGLEDGCYTERDADGKIQIQGYKTAGEWDGVYMATKPNGDIVSMVYDHGEVVGDRFTVSTPGGFGSSYRFSDGSLIVDHPSVDSVRVERFEDLDWLTYDMNGITLSVHINKVRDYGKYYRCDIFLWNHSYEPISLDNGNSSAYIKVSEGTYKDLDIYSLEQYEAIVQRKQNVSKAIAAICIGLSAGMGGYSTSYSTTRVGFHTYTTVMTTYNPASSFACAMASAAVLTDISRELNDEKESKKIGYFNNVTLNPGESTNGYFNIDYARGKQLTLIFTVGQEKYVFRIDN